MAAPPQPLTSLDNLQPAQLHAQPNESPKVPAAPADPPSVDGVLSAVEYHENVDLSIADHPPTVLCTPNDGDNAEVLHAQCVVAQEAAVAGPQGTTPPCPATKFNWMPIEDEDTTRVWRHFSPFLERHGIWLFGTERYKQRSLPPKIPARDPFSPTQNEDFLHRHHHSSCHPLVYRRPSPFCMIAIDDLSREIYVKAVSKTSHEWQIVEHLTSPKLKLNPANHTIPIISLLHHPDEETVFIIQAAWGSCCFTDPFFENMKERYIAACQLLEGLAFMHENRIGHGDLHISNILWNYHDMRMHRRHPDFTPVRRDFDFRFAYIDFEASVKFDTDDCHQVPCDYFHGPPGVFCSPEKTVGIGKEGATFDLFLGDVYGLGQILIYEASLTNVVLPPKYNALLSEMTAEEPSHRPSAAEGSKRVQEMMVTVS